MKNDHNTGALHCIRQLALTALACLAAMLLGQAQAQVSVQEYPLPRGVGVHDVWADPAADGPVWFSAQGSGQLGRLDPVSYTHSPSPRD